MTKLVIAYENNMHVFLNYFPPPFQLFDFDVEVQPVLEVLVGKTMEQSLLEVMEEEEMAWLRAQQRSFQELRDAELAEVQRLEEQECRRCEEKVWLDQTENPSFSIASALSVRVVVSISSMKDPVLLSFSFSMSSYFLLSILAVF